MVVQFHRYGMVTVEAVLLWLLVGVALWLAAGLGRHVQQQAKIRQTEDQVLTLREAVLAYRQAVGRFPTGRADGDCAAVLVLLGQEKSSADRLTHWLAGRGGEMVLYMGDAPAEARGSVELSSVKPPAGLSGADIQSTSNERRTTSSPSPVLSPQLLPTLAHDPWGRPLRYWTAAFAREELLNRIQMDQSIPIFQSAGPDGQFGNDDPATRSDNIASDTALMLQAE
ncbi:MAG: hypothetical protein HJJLKODD_01946 [Phycisphaerae bacterium]|nr:hypothetical protein [Phycisphaerae bacterium]